MTAGQYKTAVGIALIRMVGLRLFSFAEESTSQGLCKTPRVGIALIRMVGLRRLGNRTRVDPRRRFQSELP